MVHVLYVDDEECLLDICQTFLGHMGNISVDTARSVDEGLKLVALNNYDAIISDYEMPVKNGVDFLKHLRSGGNRIPFIIFTGRGREEIVIEAINNGADFYLQKGGETKSQFAELIHKIRMAVERRRGERALENSNSLLRATLESTADGILAVDSSGSVTICNQKFLQMWNLTDGPDSIRTEQEFLDQVRDQVVDGVAFERPLAASRTNPESISYDIIPCRDGRTFRRFSQAQKAGSCIVGRVWSYRDITGQDRTGTGAAPTVSAGQPAPLTLSADATALPEPENPYRGIFEAAVCPLLVVDRASQEILELNAAAAALYGYGKGEMAPFSPAESNDTTAPGITTPGCRAAFHTRKNGTTFAAECEAVPVLYKNREAFVISVRDCSGARLREETLRLSNKKLSLLSGITRHDVLNKLSALAGYNEILMTQAIDYERAGAMLEKQQNLIDMIWRIVEFSKEYDQLGVNAPGWLRVDEIAGGVYQQMPATVPFECMTDTLEIYADALMEKVFYNLFDNALRYGKGMSGIRLAWCRSGDDLLIRFEDNGIGIPEEEKERIFEQGYGKNTGLGLFLIREILTVTGMSIAETGEYTKGARFEIRIPAGNYRFSPKVTEQQDYGNRSRILASE